MPQKIVITLLNNNLLTLKHNKMELQKNPFMTTQLINGNTGFSVWNPNTSIMTDEEYIEILKENIQVSKANHQVKYILADMRQFAYTMGTEVQAWVLENYGVGMKDAGILRMAIVMPNDFIANLSVEQAVDESKKEVPVNYFSNFEDAENWLYASSTIIV